MEIVLRDTRNILTVSAIVFSCAFNRALVHQVVVAYAAGSRQGTRAQKTRAEVSGSGKKPWRQKGTGRARSGSIRSPIWRSGGVAFAARPQDHSQKINKKMYRAALRSILSELLRQDRLIVVSNFSLEIPKTKFLIKKLKDMGLDSVLLILNEKDKNLILASRNLYKIDIRNVTTIDPISLIVFDKVLMTENALKRVEDMLL